MTRRVIALLVFAAGCTQGSSAEQAALMASAAVRDQGVYGYRIAGHEAELIGESGATVGHLVLRRVDSSTLAIDLRTDFGSEDTEVTRPTADGSFLAPAGQGTLGSALRADPSLAPLFALEKLRFTTVAMHLEPIETSEWASCAGCGASCFDVGCNIFYQWDYYPTVYSSSDQYCSCPPVSCPADQRDIVMRTRWCVDPGSCSQSSGFWACSG